MLKKKPHLIYFTGKSATSCVTTVEGDLLWLQSDGFGEADDSPLILRLAHCLFPIYITAITKTKTNIT